MSLNSLRALEISTDISSESERDGGMKMYFYNIAIRDSHRCIFRLLSADCGAFFGIIFYNQKFISFLLYASLVSEHQYELIFDGILSNFTFPS